MNYFSCHLRDIDESYFEHARHALGFAAAMFVGSLACAIHALLPFTFVRTGSRTIHRLYDRMVVNRRNLKQSRQPVTTDQRVTSH